ncbi:MAG: hypothetical protein AAGJ18_10235 [Bacteroidota bacterium]
MYLAVGSLGRYGGLFTTFKVSSQYHGVTSSVPVNPSGGKM